MLEVDSNKTAVELKRMTQNQIVEYALQLQNLLNEKGTKMETNIEANTTCWVSADGSYGQDDIIVWHPTALTDQQWENMTNMHDGDRMDYVQAILDGDLDTVVAMEMEYEEPAPTDGYYGEDHTPDYGPDTPRMSDHN